MISAQQMLAQGLKNCANDLSADLKVAAVKGKYLQDNYQDLFYTKARNLIWKLRRAFDEALTSVEIGTLRSNDATATRTSLKKVYLRSFSLYRDYSYPITLSNVGEPS